MSTLTRIRIVLVETSHPGNIGAVARAMKNMGLTNLYLVNPVLFPHAEANARAAGADDILKHAHVVSDLHSALHDCHLVYGTSARSRSLPWPLLNPRQCAEQICQQPTNHQIAILFGREKSGLTNEELALCHTHISIPCNPDFSSLNLAAAVQILAYEIYSATSHDTPINSACFATHKEMEGFYHHLQLVLNKLQFFNNDNPHVLMLRLRRLFNRVQLESIEINILRGILKAIDKHG